MLLASHVHEQDANEHQQDDAEEYAECKKHLKPPFSSACGNHYCFNLAISTLAALIVVEAHGACVNGNLFPIMICWKIRATTTFRSCSFCFRFILQLLHVVQFVLLAHSHLHGVRKECGGLFIFNHIHNLFYFDYVYNIKIIKANHIIILFCFASNTHSERLSVGLRLELFGQLLEQHQHTLTRKIQRRDVFFSRLVSILVCSLNLFITMKQFHKSSLRMSAKLFSSELYRLNLLTDVFVANRAEHEFVFSSLDTLLVVLLVCECKFSTIIFDALLPDQCTALSHRKAVIEACNTGTSHHTIPNGFGSARIELGAIIRVSIGVNAICLDDLFESNLCHVVCLLLEVEEFLRKKRGNELKLLRKGHVRDVVHVTFIADIECAINDSAINGMPFLIEGVYDLNNICHIIPLF